MGAALVVIISLVLSVALVAVLRRQGNPEQTAGHEGEPVDRAAAAGRDNAGPAGPGAEDMDVRVPGDPGPGSPQ